MSTFAVTVEKITITEHPNADALELANIADYQAIVRKGQFSTGDLVAYIPEQAIVPQVLLKEMGLEGKLAGKQANRVKAIKLRGILSQGLVYPARPEWQEGADVTELLGITKWEPPAPAHLAGEMYSAGLDRTLKYDIENIKKYPRVLEPGEQVVFTEKLHGCLHETSMVLLSDGSECPITNVVADPTIGSVLSYNEQTKEYIERPITGRMRRENSEGKKWVKLILENGSTLTLTEDHPIYSRDQQTWIQAGEISPGEDIESPIM
jgi:hypothetical protein